MNFFKKLFNPSSDSIQEDSKSKQDSKVKYEPSIHAQDDKEPRLGVKPSSISHAFIALTPPDMKYSKHVEDKVADLNKHTQPDLWSKKISAKFSVLSAEVSGGGFPDPQSICHALEKIGLTMPYSLVAWDLTVSFDGGTTNTKMLVGFAYKDAEPKIFLARKNGCKPI